MKICRFTEKNSSIKNYGIVEGDVITRLSTTHIFSGKFEKANDRFELSEIRLLPPIEPSKIVCVGRNYSDHARELGNEVPAEPLLFLKAPSSLIAADQPILLPPQSARVEHEGELGVVIGREAKNLSDSEDPLDYVLGYLCLNDVTARDLQKADVQFTRAKSFDTFCPIGFFIETELTPDKLDLTVRVNGIVRQHGNTAQMVFPVKNLIRYISRQMTLLPGDLLATGTPAGVSRLDEGDVCEVEIEGIGVLRNPVAK